MGLSIALRVSRATSHGVKPVGTTLEGCLTYTCPKRSIGEGAYDRDGLDKCVVERGIAMVMPYPHCRYIARMQEGRKLRLLLAAMEGRMSIFSGGW